jgi:hypothetical protein
MVSRAFQPSAVSDEPQIHKCCPTQAGQPCTPMAENEDHGDVLIIGLWERGTDCILDVRVMDTDAPTYQMKNPHKVIEAAEHLNKKKYLQPCLDQRRHFTSFIVSVDGLIRKEAETVLKVLAARTTAKAGKTYSNITGYIRARLSIIVRATHVCLRASRVPTSQTSSIPPHWDDRVGMALLKYYTWIEKPTVRFAQNFRTKKSKKRKIRKGYTLPHFPQTTSIHTTPVRVTPNYLK